MEYKLKAYHYKCTIRLRQAIKAMNLGYLTDEIILILALCTNDPRLRWECV